MNLFQISRIDAFVETMHSMGYMFTIKSRRAVYDPTYYRDELLKLQSSQTDFVDFCVHKHL